MWREGAWGSTRAGAHSECPPPPAFTVRCWRKNPARHAHSCVFGGAELLLGDRGVHANLCRAHEAPTVRPQPRAHNTVTTMSLPCGRDSRRFCRRPTKSCRTVATLQHRTIEARLPSLLHSAHAVSALSRLDSIRHVAMLYAPPFRTAACFSASERMRRRSSG